MYVAIGVTRPVLCCPFHVLEDAPISIHVVIRMARRTSPLCDSLSPVLCCLPHVLEDVPPSSPTNLLLPPVLYPLRLLELLLDDVQLALLLLEVDHTPISIYLCFVHFFTSVSGGKS